MTDDYLTPREVADHYRWRDVRAARIKMREIGAIDTGYGRLLLSRAKLEAWDASHLAPPRDDVSTEHQRRRKVRRRPHPARLERGWLENYDNVSDTRPPGPGVAPTASEGEERRG